MQSDNGSEPVTLPRVMTPGEVARLFRVDPKTVTRWIKEGRFPKGCFFRTPGGHHRFYRKQVEEMFINLGNTYE